MAGLQHRGPDSEGFYTNEDGTVAIGHRRLCILDLSTAAAQPMSFQGTLSPGVQR
jgi:asparagine synthase (glutamine-hydrolysing)